MDDFLEFSTLFCSKKKKRKDCLYWRLLKQFSDWTKVHLYPLLVEEKKNLLQSENGLYQHDCITSKEKLKSKSRIKLNHKTFKVITELLKSGTSVKKMENKANNIICNNNFKAQDISFEKSHLPSFYTYNYFYNPLQLRCNNFILAKGRYQ